MKYFSLKSIPLAILVLVMSLDASQAKTNAAQTNTAKVDPVETQNHRHKTHQADRKIAAQHLRVKHQQEVQAELMNEARKYQGYSGRGRAGLPTKAVATSNPGRAALQKSGGAK
jgi:hypothetical protein